MTLSGAKMGNAADIFADVDGVVAVLRAHDEED
jgi:putative Mg2+ transporter-C (MgtC) family protein